MKFLYTDRSMALSIAASYTWAAAIIVGYSMLKEQGIIPFFLWFAANTTAILVFGAVTLKWPKLWNAVRLPVFRLIMTAVLFGIIWFNMSGIMFINSELGLLSETGARILAICTAVVLWAVMSYGGIRWSIITDKFQWFLLAGAAAIAILITLFSGGTEAGLVNTSLKIGSYSGFRDWIMGLWSIPLLLTALFVDGMFWHRARYISTMKPYWQAFGLFTFYLALVAVLGFLNMPRAAIFVIFIAVYFSSQSTMDSCFTGLQLSITKKWGIAAGALAIGTWLLVSMMGILDLWAMLFGWFPFFFIALVIAYYLQKRGILKDPSDKVLKAEDSVPPIAGRGRILTDWYDPEKHIRK